MKTALDWLIEQMPYEFRANHTQEIFKEAKTKEKEQIVDAYEAAMERPIDNYAEAYYNMNYNQTYNNEKD